MWEDIGTIHNAVADYVPTSIDWSNAAR